MKSRYIHCLVALAATVPACAWMSISNSVSAAGPILTVNSTADRDDAVADGVCQTSVAGECTLRAALTEATAVTNAPVRIEFAIPGSGVKRIAVKTRLPLIDNGTAGITIDGFTQPGSRPNTDPLVDNAVRLIDIVGTGPNGIDGLIMLGSNNTIRGVAIHGFKRAVRMTGANAQYNQVVGNIVGLQADGTLDPTYDRIIGSPCIDINNGASRNRIGMPGNENRNVISGCYEKGVTFYNQFTWKNYVQNNLIGLDPTGTQRRGNGSMGIDINWSANGTIIGGTATQEHNVISGNYNSGVEISHGTGTINNKVIGNYIGTDPTGTSASAATINHDIGVRLEGKPDCGTSACPADESKETVTDNVIVNSGWGGILVDKGTHDSLIANNLIGVTLNGTVVGNNSFGIRIAAGATHITVGPGNTIVGAHPGIQVSALGYDPASDVASVTQYNTFTRNSIGTTAGLGIDFMPSGTVNQGGNGNPSIQERIDVPRLAAQGDTVVATTCAGCIVELFASGAAIGSNGPGTTFMASAVADTSGSATFAKPAAGWPAAATATTTTANGSTSEFAANIRPGAPGVPGAPGSVSAVAGVGSAQVTFGAAADNGSAVTSYTVTALDQTSAGRGGQVASGAGSPLTVSGLSNGDSYVFTVTATNAVGTGPASNPSNAVTPSAGATISATSLSPRVLGQSASYRTVKLNGSGFKAGASVAIGGGVTVKSVAVTSATVLTLMVSVAPDAAPGTRDVAVSAADGGSATCVGCFTVSAAPTISSVSPSSFVRGAAASAVDIVGTGFNTGIKVSVSGAGMTVGTVSRIDAGHLQVNLSASASADLGNHTITLTNTDAGISPPTTIVVTDAGVPGAPTSVSASAGMQSAQVTFGAAADNGSAVTSYTVHAVDQTDAARGGQVVTGSGSPLTVTGLTSGDTYVFTVSATNAIGTGPASAPSNGVVPTSPATITVTSLSPQVLGQSASWRTVKLNGSGFAAGASVMMGNGVTVKSVTVSSPTLLTLMVSVAGDAAPGPRDVVVTGTDGGTGTCAGCFTVSPAPTITSVTPNALTRGQSGVVVDVVGATFNSGVKVSVSGSGVSVGTVTRIDSGHLQVTLSASATADLGAHSLTVTNTDAGVSAPATVTVS